jgi:DNA (cytosine-5)-methyltransferase 1
MEVEKKKIKVLNLYSGLGGNRKLWPNDKIEVTAVEINPEIAAIYQEFFPKDKVIVGDAHQYLLEHYKEFDFIWSSPPCPSHSKFRFMTTKMTKKGQKRPIIYPDMNLYQEIILLKHYFKGKWIVENVQGYYEPLIIPQKVSRHYLWSNFNIPIIKINQDNLIKKHHTALSKSRGFDLSKFKISKKDTLLRNCVLPEIGLHIFNAAWNK